MADTFDGIPTDGNVKVVIVPTIANGASPTVTELNAVSAKDISCLITADGLGITEDQDSISDQRLCDRGNYELPGRVTNTLELTYVRSSVTANDLAFTTLTPGATGWVVIRMGSDYAAPFAAADVVHVWPYKAGERRVVASAPNEVFRRVQKLFTRGKVYKDVAVVTS